MLIRAGIPGCSRVNAERNTQEFTAKSIAEVGTLQH